MTATPAPNSSASGAIYDLGYRHYDGKRLGRAGAVRALFIDGLRTLFGLGRGTRAKIPPVALIVCTIVPALIQAAVIGLVGPGIQLFRHDAYFASTVWIFALFCAFQTPELVTGDQQYRVLALYLSRAILRFDYILARFAALATALFLVALTPHLILLLGTCFAAAEVGTAFKDALPLLPRIVFTALAIAMLMASVSLMVASLLRRRTFATGAILAIFLLTSLFTAPLVHFWPQRMQAVILVSPTLVGDGVSKWVFDSTGVMEVADTAEMFGPVPTPLAATSTAKDTAAFRLANRRRNRRRESMTAVQAANLPGGAYLLAMAGYLILAGGVLTLRYRRIDT